MGLFGFGKKSPEPGSGEQDPTQFTMPANAEQSNEGASVEVAPEINLAPPTEEATPSTNASENVITDKNDPNYDAFAALNQARQASAAESEAIAEERKQGLNVLAAEEPSFGDIVKPVDSDEVHAVGAQVMSGQIPQADEASMQEALSEVEKLGVTGDEVIIDKASAIETTGVVKEDTESSSVDASPIEAMPSENDPEKAA